MPVCCGAARLMLKASQGCQGSAPAGCTVAVLSQRSRCADYKRLPAYSHFVAVSSARSTTRWL